MHLIFFAATLAKLSSSKHNIAFSSEKNPLHLLLSFHIKIHQRTILDCFRSDSFFTGESMQRYG